MEPINISERTVILVLKNDTFQAGHHLPGALSIFFHSLIIIIAALILISNLLTLIVIVKYRILRKTTNILIISLTLSDLLVGFHLPICYLKTLLHSPYRQFCVYCLAALSTNVLISILTLLGIAAERYLAIVYPLMYEVRMSAKIIISGAVAFWMYSIIHSSINWAPNDLAHLKVYYEQHHFTCQPKAIFEKWFTRSFLIHCCVVLVCCSFMYFRIYKTAVNHVHRMHENVCLKRSNRSTEEARECVDEQRNKGKKTENENGTDEEMECLQEGNKKTAITKSSSDSKEYRDGSNKSGEKALSKRWKGKVKAENRCLECRKHKIAKMTFYAIQPAFLVIPCSKLEHVH